MNATEKPYKSDILSDQEIRRYALQINNPEIGISGQEKLKMSKVLVIGAGGKGTSVLQNLASTGIGCIGISDNYPVEEHELSRQSLYGNNDLGKQKAIVSRQKLLDINALTEYKLHNVCLSENNISSIIEGYDILVDVTDNFPAHYLINDAAVSLKKPVVFGSVVNNTGLVSVFNYMNGPSLRCLYPKSPKGQKKPAIPGFACQISLMTIVGSIIANEIIKIILGKKSGLNGDLLKIDIGSYSFDMKKIFRNPENFPI